MADVERDLIHTRTAGSRNRAKAQGRPWADPVPDIGATEGGQQTACAGRDAARIGEELQRRNTDNSPRHPLRVTRNATYISRP